MADEQAANQQQAEQQFTVQRIYTKDVSFESPGTPAVFKQQWQPKVSVDLNTRSSAIDEQGNFEVILSLTITAKLEEQAAFLIEVQQAGIFFVSGIQGDNLRRILATAAPNILFPYARETIDSICVKGGFPALMIAPVNFDAVYQRAQAQAQAEAQSTANDDATATH